MNGLQFYLRRPMPIVHGHVIHIDTEWALTSISQFQFWQHGSFDPYEGRGEVRDILSVDVSDWGQPGLNGRPARDCNRKEVAEEVWRQLKLSLEQAGADVLRDEDLRAWFLDPDIQPGPTGSLINVEPLLVNLADTWRLRPEAVTAVPNLFLASDYVRTYTDLATMEGANEAGRRAANGILDSIGYNGPRCRLWPLEEPTVLAPFREYDAARFKLGLPWDGSLVSLAVKGLEAAAPELSEVSSLMRDVQPFVSAVEQVKLEVDQLQRDVGMSEAEHLVMKPLEELRDQAAWLDPTTSPVMGPELITAGAGPAESPAESPAAPPDPAAAPPDPTAAPPDPTAAPPDPQPRRPT